MALQQPGMRGGRAVSQRPNFLRSLLQMYMLGAHLISLYSGMPYTEFVKERIWDRLDMSSTTFSAANASKEGNLTQSWTAQGRRIPFWIPDEMIELNSGPDRRVGCYYF
jgi:CubicO group peptidase (beta-lactamase class C family)